MKQIKVNDTRMQVVIPHGSTMHHDKLVVEGKLVLIKVDFNQVTKESAILNHKPILSDSITQIKPIIISETEKIEEGDWMYHYPTKTINRFVKGDMHCAKILVLPEQFSPKHLQAIVDDKMKNGDRVLVECESYCTYGDNCPSKGAYDKQHLCDIQYRIKLNSQGHVTLHKVEEKMYTKEEVYNLLLKHQSDYRSHVRKTNDWSMDINKWFEQNI